jgi:hypothetical protein
MVTCLCFLRFTYSQNVRFPDAPLPIHFEFKGSCPLCVAGRLLVYTIEQDGSPGDVLYSAEQANILPYIWTRAQGMRNEIVSSSREVAELVIIPAFISFCFGMLSLISLSGSQHVCQPGRNPDRMRELVLRA